MSSPQSETPDRWNTRVVPAAQALEKFFWNLAWFTLFVFLLFGGPCVSRSSRSGDRHEETNNHPPQQHDLPELQHQSESGKR